MKTALSHLRWSEKDECFNAPSTKGLRATIDGRSNVQCGTAGVETPGSLICVLDDGAELDDSYTLLSTEDPRDTKPDGKTLDTIESLFGRRPQGDTLADCIADLLMTGCDPLGLDTCKPLMPTFDRVLEVHLFGKVYERPFVFGSDQHTNAVQSVLQAEFRKTFEDAQGGKFIDPEHHLKVLDYWCDKLRLDKSDRTQWEKLVPIDLRGEIDQIPDHDTALSEDFNGTDGDTIGNVYTWVEDSGDFDRLSNQVILNAAATAMCHATTALSGADHFAQVSVIAQGTANGAGNRITGTLVRYTDQNNFYYGGINNVAGGTAFRDYKRVAGVDNQVGTDGTVTVSLPQFAKIHINGSTLTGYWNGSAVSGPGGTDTSLASGTLCGIWMRVGTTTATVDNWSAEDLAVAAILLPGEFYPGGNVAFAGQLSPGGNVRFGA